MAQATFDQPEELTVSTGYQANKHAQQKEDISLRQYEGDNYVQLDPHGLPLSPQPSQWKDDPLVGAHPLRLLGVTVLITSIELVSSHEMGRLIASEIYPQLFCNYSFEY